MSRDILPTFEEIHDALRNEFNGGSSSITYDNTGSDPTLGATGATTDPETRQKALERELSELKSLNESMEGIIRSFQTSSENLLKLHITSDSSINLLNRWVRILSQTNSTKERLINANNGNLKDKQQLTEEEYEENVAKMNKLAEAVQQKKLEITNAEIEARRVAEEEERVLQERREAMQRRLYGRKGSTATTTSSGSTPVPKTPNNNRGVQTTTSHRGGNTSVGSRRSRSGTTGTTTLNESSNRRSLFGRR